MNNQLQIPWVQPCEEINLPDKSWLAARLQNWMQKIACQFNKLDQFANSLNAPNVTRDDQASQFISRNILR
jgi:hypothetical protein